MSSLYTFQLWCKMAYCNLKTQSQTCFFPCTSNITNNSNSIHVVAMFSSSRACHWMLYAARMHSPFFHVVLMSIIPLSRDFFFFFFFVSGITRLHFFTHVKCTTICPCSLYQAFPVYMLYALRIPTHHPCLAIAQPPCRYELMTKTPWTTWKKKQPNLSVHFASMVSDQ